MNKLTNFKSAVLAILASTVTLTACAKSTDATYTVPDMVTIPAGNFVMGDESKKSSPQHKVNIPSFKMGKYEITVKEFRQFVNDTGHKTQEKCWKWQEITPDHDWGINIVPGDWTMKQYAPSDDHPVMCVTWNDAKAYAKWLSDKTGRQFRLPSESEWEYAARAGSESDYSFGDDPTKLCEYGNVLDVNGSLALARDHQRYRKAIVCDDGAEYTNKVGQYKPNAYGLYDMIGNVGEFVMDCEHLSYEGAPADGSAWNTGCNQENFMVIERGGSYGSRAPYATVSYRGHAGPDNASSLGEGFRLAETITVQ